VRRQSGLNTRKTAKIAPYDANPGNRAGKPLGTTAAPPLRHEPIINLATTMPVWPRPRKSASYDGSLAKTLRCRKRTTRPRLFGRKRRCQSGHTLKNLAMPALEKVRREKSSQHTGSIRWSNVISRKNAVTASSFVEMRSLDCPFNPTICVFMREQCTREGGTIAVSPDAV